MIETESTEGIRMWFIGGQGTSLSKDHPGQSPFSTLLPSAETFRDFKGGYGFPSHTACGWDIGTLLPIQIAAFPLSSLPKAFSVPHFSLSYPPPSLEEDLSFCPHLSGLLLRVTETQAEASRLLTPALLILGYKRWCWSSQELTACRIHRGLIIPSPHICHSSHRRMDLHPALPNARAGH